MLPTRNYLSYHQLEQHLTSNLFSLMNFRKTFLFRSFALKFVLFILVFVLFLSSNTTNQYFLLETVESPCQRVCPYTSTLKRDRFVFDRWHSIRHFPDFVCPQNFRNLADWIYGWPDQFFESLEYTTRNGTEIAPCLPDGSIIYVRGSVMKDFFDQIYPALINKFVLITGEADETMPLNISYLDRTDSKIIHWFGQNGGIEAERSSKFTHIPIGINCYEMADAIRTIQKQNSAIDFQRDSYRFQGEPSGFHLPIDITKRILSNVSIEKKSFTLINYSPDSDPTGFRQRLWTDLCNKKNGDLLITCLTKPGGVQPFRLVNIYQRNRQYPLWISPRGHGIDCHRTWESLYLDVIPIVWNTTLSVLYKDLPMIVINDHQNLTQTFLYDQMKKISKNKEKQINSSSFVVYQYAKLRNSYWRRLILSKSRYFSQMHNFTFQRRCWRAKSTLFEWVRYLPFLKYF